MNDIFTRWGQRLGTPGIAAIGLLVFCAALYFSASRPLHAELARLEAARSAQPTASVPTRNLAQEMTELLRNLPREAEFAGQLARIHQIARRQGVALRRGGYDFSSESHGRIGRQQMSFQAQAPYTSVRGFLREALVAMPALVLEEVVIMRPQGEADGIEASLRFSMLLAREGGA